MPSLDRMKREFGTGMEDDKLYVTRRIPAVTGTQRSVEVSQTMTEASSANMVEALYVRITSNVRTGAWANAIVGSIDYSTSGSANGLAAAICAEMIPPDGSLSRGALYALDLEFGCGASSSWGNAGPVAFIKMENWGTASHFSANAFLLHLAGETSSSGNLLYNETLKVRIGTSTRYLVMSTAEGTYTTAYPIVVSSTTGIRSTATFVPDSTRTNYAFCVGNRVTELDVTMAASASQHFEPIQMNVNIIGANPSGTSTTNLMYALLTHDTVDMAALRIKCTDFNVSIGENVKDAYCYQGEVDFVEAGITIGGEAAVLGLVMNAGSDAVTGKVRGIIISMQGTGSPADTVGIELRSTATTQAEGIRISGTPQTTVGIAMGNQTNDNEGPVNAFFFPTGPSADQGPVLHTAEAGTGAGSIKIKIGSSLKYLQYWDNAA